MTDLDDLKAGELLLLAIKEARKYPPEKLFMPCWVRINKDGSLCSVCLAGAVLVSQYPDVAHAELVRRDFTSGIHQVYWDIDDLRCGSVSQRFFDTPAKYVAARNIPIEILRHVYGASSKPWVNDWSSLSAFAEYLTMHNI